MPGLLITEGLSPPFAGWSFDSQGLLCDPAGNRYLPTDLQASFWCRRAWEARAGYPGELRFLKAELDARLRASVGALVVQVLRETPGGALSLVASQRIPWQAPSRAVPAPQRAAEALQQAG